MQKDARLIGVSTPRSEPPLSEERELEQRRYYRRDVNDRSRDVRTTQGTRNLLFIPLPLFVVIDVPCTRTCTSDLDTFNNLSELNITTSPEFQKIKSMSLRFNRTYTSSSDNLSRFYVCAKISKKFQILILIIILRILFNI